MLEFPEIAYFAVFDLKPERGAKRAVMASLLKFPNSLNLLNLLNLLRMLKVLILLKLLKWVVLMVRVVGVTNVIFFCFQFSLLVLTGW